MVDEVCGCVEMVDVIVFDFEVGLVGVVGFKDVGDVFEGVVEDVVIGVGQVGLFLVVVEIFEVVQYFIQVEVY